MLITFIRFRSRRLHGRSGLKSEELEIDDVKLGSPPSRAEWIEMEYFCEFIHNKESPPSRAEWIEIILTCANLLSVYVAAFTGGVD